MAKERVLESGELSDITSEEDNALYHPRKIETARKKLPRKRQLKSCINHILIDFAPGSYRDDITDTRRKIMKLISVYRSRKYEEFQKLSQQYERDAEKNMKNKQKKTSPKTASPSTNQNQSDKVSKELLRLLDTKEYCSTPPAQSKRCSKKVERFEDTLFGNSTQATGEIHVIDSSDDDDLDSDQDCDFNNGSDYDYEDNLPLSLRKRRQNLHKEKGNYLDDIETYLCIKRSRIIDRLVREDGWKVARNEGSALRLLRKRAKTEQDQSSKSNDQKRTSISPNAQNPSSTLSNDQNGWILSGDLEDSSAAKRKRTQAKLPGARSCVSLDSSSDDDISEPTSNSNGWKVAVSSNCRKRGREHVFEMNRHAVVMSDSSSYDDCSLVHRMKQTTKTTVNMFSQETQLPAKETKSMVQTTEPPAKKTQPPVKEIEPPVFITISDSSSNEDDPDEMDLEPANGWDENASDGSQTQNSPQYIPAEETSEENDEEEPFVTSSPNEQMETIPDLGDFEQVYAYSLIQLEPPQITSNTELVPGLDDFDEILERFDIEKSVVEEIIEASQLNEETEAVADGFIIHGTSEVGAEGQVIGGEDEIQTQPIGNGMPTKDQAIHDNDKIPTQPTENEMPTQPIENAKSVQECPNEISNSELPLNGASTVGLDVIVASTITDVKPKDLQTFGAKNFQHKRKKMYHIPMVIKVEKLDYEEDNGVE